MNEQLHEAFVNRMRAQLGDGLTAFLHALDEPPLRGIRLNPMKQTEATARYTREDPIPWQEKAWYLEAESEAGSSFLHEIGAYYIQEPGAMMPAAVLDAQPGETVLDLCAAPGGKSTQMGLAMKGQGLLVCNEPVQKRAQILSRNVERMGLPHTVVTCAMPDQLARKWPEGFDAVMVDAPCSGEGMFRRDPATRNEWTPEKAEGCAVRQREILREAARLVRPGGRLVYSTCTYNPEENERNAAWFLEQFPEFTPEAFSLPGIDAPQGMYTCYPHCMKAEGQFAARFRKAGEGCAKLPEDASLKKPLKAERAVLESSFPYFPEATHQLGPTMVSIPFLPDIRGIRVLRTGLHLGEVRGKIAVPDHASALCVFPPDALVTDLTGEQALKYAAGETIPGDAAGWTLMRYEGLGAGWGKGSGGIIKNHYPKGLRSIRYTIQN